MPEQYATQVSQRKPEWLKKRLSLSNQRPMKNDLRTLNLHSVCEEASCPNISECFSKGVATVMIMGDTCTRACKFCDVKTGRPKPLDPNEPDNVASWAKTYNLRHIVITSVDRDDLKDDLGSTHFASVVTRTKEENPKSTIEVLTPDFQGREECIERVATTPILVYNHNLETIERLTAQVRSASNYRRSLKVIQYIKNHHPKILTKSGLMLGLGEKHDEVLQSMSDMVAHGCDLLTLGQYLQPSKEHLAVQEFIHPDRFAEYKELGEKMGFRAVFSGPFVRSSYLADELVEGIVPEGFTV